LGRIGSIQIAPIFSPYPSARERETDNQQIDSGTSQEE
jgi:hypothetical protein